MDKATKINFNRKNSLTQTNFDDHKDFFRTLGAHKIRHASFDTDSFDDYTDSYKDERVLDHRYLASNSKKTKSTKVNLNIGGVKHVVLWKTLDRLPNSRLGKLKNATFEEISKLTDGYDDEENEFYFDQNPESFAAILNFYRTGKLHLNEDVCALSFEETLKYWGIEEFYLETCCLHKYQKKKEDILADLSKEKEILEQENYAETFKSCCPDIQKKIWNSMKSPVSLLN